MKPVYITWDVLTYGIRRGTIDEKSPEHQHGAFIFVDGKTRGSVWYSKEEFFTKKSEAIKNADLQRKAKIEQLKLEIERLERMEFS